MCKTFKLNLFVLILKMLFTRSAQGPLREPVGFCSVTKETIMEYNVFL